MVSSIVLHVRLTRWPLWDVPKQTITWANINQDLCQYMVSPDHNWFNIAGIVVSSNKSTSEPYLDTMNLFPGIHQKVYLFE